jgi:hypothetical protein
MSCWNASSNLHGYASIDTNRKRYVGKAVAVTQLPAEIPGPPHGHHESRSHRRLIR